MRYTERHGGVAVIKDKSKHKEAMEKLAKVEDLEDKHTDIDKLTTEMMEHICDNLCKHPTKAKDQEELDEICSSCQMGQFVCDVLNTYNRLKDFELGGKAYIHQFNKEGVLYPVQGSVVAIGDDFIRILIHDGRQLNIPKNSKGLFLTEREARAALEKMKNH